MEWAQTTVECGVTGPLCFSLGPSHNGAQRSSKEEHNGTEWIVTPMVYINICESKKKDYDREDVTMQNSVVDYGNTNCEFTFQFPAGTKKGQTVRQHIDPETFIEHVGITNADIFNPTGMKITTASEGTYGISAFHDSADPDSWVKTSNRVPLLAPNISAVHQHVSIPGHLHSNDVRLRPTPDQLQDRAVANTRKALNTWATMGESNIHAGVHKSKLGDKTRYIVTKGSVVDGVETSSAMHAYISRNANNPKFMKGMFTPTKVHMSHVNGEQGYVIDESTYDTMKSMLSGVVKTHSPFGKGFGIAVTKLDDRVDNGVHVNVGFTRTPLTIEGEFMPVHESEMGVMEHHLRTPGEGSAAVKPDSTLVPGWEDQKNLTKDMIAGHVVEEVTGSDD